MPELVLEASDLRKTYRPRGRLARDREGGREEVRPALVDVSMSLRRGETLGVVGESGSGKSTLAKCLVLLERPDSGRVLVNGEDLTALRGDRLRRARRRTQIVFQDPYSSLNPHMRVGDAIGEVIRLHHLRPRGDILARVGELLRLVGLPESAAGGHPAQFSGGQRQRICLARALAAEPDLLIADEPVSALDVSIQAQILNLLTDLRDRLGLSMIFISHNLFVVQYVTSRIAIMFGGRIVEVLDQATSLESAQHPYTKALVAAAPTLGAPLIAPGTSTGDTGLAQSLPASGCPYRDRCQYALPICEAHDPPLVGLAENGHMVACHYVSNGGLAVRGENRPEAREV